MKRFQAINIAAEMIGAIELSHPVRVAIDGIDCSGKTMLADELVEPLRSQGREVIRASIDEFHNPKEIRLRQGYTSPQGYYEDSFDHTAIKDALLFPLGPGGNLRYQVAKFSFRREAEVESPWIQAGMDTILLFDGVFLHRPELVAHFDYTIFDDVSFDISVQRALVRDRKLFGSVDNAERRYIERYVPGQRLYLETCNPTSKADLVFNNNDIEQPKLSIRKCQTSQHI